MLSANLTLERRTKVNKFQKLIATAEAAIQVGDKKAALSAFSEFAGFPVTEAHLKELDKILNLRIKGKRRVNHESKN